MTVWIAVPAGRQQDATRALIDAQVPVEGTWTGPTPGTPTPPRPAAERPRRDPAGLFLAISLGGLCLAAGARGLYEGGWWTLLGSLGLVLGLVCIAGALSLPKTPAGTSAEARDDLPT